MKTARAGLFFAGVATLAAAAAAAAWLYHGDASDGASDAAAKADAKPVIGNEISPAPGAESGLASLGGALSHGTADATGWRSAATALPKLPRSFSSAVPSTPSAGGTSSSGLGNWSQDFSAYGGPTDLGGSASPGGSGSGLYAMAGPDASNGMGFSGPGFGGIPGVPVSSTGPQITGNTPNGGTPGPGGDPNPGDPNPGSPGPNLAPQAPSGPSGAPNTGPDTQPIACTSDCAPVSGPPLVPVTNGPQSNPTTPTPPQQGPTITAGPNTGTPGPNNNPPIINNPPVIVSGTPPSPPPGRFPSNAFTPGSSTPPYVLAVDGCISSACPSNGWEFFDPLVAIGYDYRLVPSTAGGKLTFGITDIQVSTIVGDGIYQLFLCDTGDTVCDFATGQDIIANGGDSSADIFDVTAYLDSLSASQLALLGLTSATIDDGIFGFALRGIDPNDALSPEATFVTGLLFTGDVNGSLVITPEVVDTTGGTGGDTTNGIGSQSVPEPPTWLAFLSGFALLVPRLRARVRVRTR